MSQYHYRSQPPSAEQYDRVDVARALAFYKERFADAGDWTFAFVGNVSLPALKPLVEQYLASLPATGRNEKWREVTPGPPTGQIEKTVRKGSEARATTQMFFTGPFEYTPQNRFDLSALMALFQIKLVESLREQLGGTYSPGSSGSSGRIPRESYTISIGYPSAPENVEKLTGSVLALIDSLTTHGPTAADVDKVREQFTRSTEAARRTNSYWLASIASRTEPIDELAARNARSDEMVRNLTPAQIQAAARKYFDRANFARFILLPESVQ
jgi:zinc protease